MTREIDAATQLTAIFGDPVEHSLSPAMHNAAYAALGLNRRYVAFHVRPAELATALDSIAALGILGVNLTVPHKERAARMLKSLSAEARLLGAVNCVINRGGKLRGDNTDARGLQRHLDECEVKVGGATVIVIGAGGAASAAVIACQRMRASRIVIANRTPARARALARRFRMHGASHLEARGLEALCERTLLRETSLILNATPMGLTTSRFAKLDYPASRNDCFFYDLLYAKSATPFLRPALRLRRRCADGAGMLIAQGELAFRLFNGVAPPRGVMKRAVLRALGRT